MTKKELIRQIAADMSITHRKAERFVTTFQDILTSELQKDEPVMLQGFGTFYPWKQKERHTHNPYTHTLLVIKARTSAKFKPGKFLLQALNKEDEEI